MILGVNIGALETRDKKTRNWKTRHKLRDWKKRERLGYEKPIKRKQPTHFRTLI